MEPMVAIDTVAALLDHLSLDHLHAELNGETLAAWRELKRTALLSRLKELNVTRLADRQALANGLSKMEREAVAAAAPPAPAPQPTFSPPRRVGAKGRILCLHGGASSGEIMKIQLQRFYTTLGEDYEFKFANAPTKQPLDPASPQARILNAYFGGLPVLRWMRIIEKVTGADAHIVGGGVVPTAKRYDKHGKQLDMLEWADELKRRRNGTTNAAAAGGAPTAAAAAAVDVSDASAPAAGADEATALTTEGEAGAAASISSSSTAEPAAVAAAEEAAKAGSPGYGQAITALNGGDHAYDAVETGESLRALARLVRQEGPFDGVLAFSQGANLLAIWLALVEAGVLDASWAAPRWACLICSTQWGWAEAFDARADELAQAIGPGLGARIPAEVRRKLEKEVIGAEASGANGGSGGSGGSRTAAQTALRRLDSQLMSAAPLGIPSIHLIGEKDPALPFSYATTKMYATAPTPTTTRTYDHKAAATAPAEAAMAELVAEGAVEGAGAAPFQVVVEHPNDHMPPKQREVVAEVAKFAERFSPRVREPTFSGGG